jgi:hypothetical protein
VCSSDLVKPALDKKTKEEVLTAGRSATSELPLEVISIDNESVRSGRGEGQQEVHSVYAGDLRRPFLRNLATRIPVDRRGQTQFASEFLGRPPKG